MINEALNFGFMRKTYIAPLIGHLVFQSKPRLLTWASPGTLLSATVILSLFIFAEIKLLALREFADESETVVAAQLIGDNKVLYSQIFNHHGPGAFLAALAMDALGFHSLEMSRVPVLVLKIVLLVAIFIALRSRTANERLAVLATCCLLFFAGTVFSWLNAGVYQVYAGLFIAFAAIFLVIPNFSSNDSSSRVLALLGAAFASFLPMFAVWYLPVSVLLICAGYTRRLHAQILLGCGISIFAGIVIFSTIANFPAYVSDHILMNAVVMPKFRPATETVLLSTPLESVIYVLLPVALIILAAILCHNWESKTRIRMWLYLASITVLYVRGVSFHAMPAYISAIALVPVLLPTFTARLLSVRSTRLFSSRLFRSAFIWPTLFLAIAVYLVGISPYGLKWQDGQHISAETPFSKIVARMTLPSDRILVYPFNPYEYIRTKRLPASGNFFYFPWQADQRLQTFPTRPIDTCKDLEMRPPKVISLEDNGIIWFGQTWSEYSGCIGSFIDQHYRKVAENTYLRYDLKGP